jgi:hypothetical protein
MEFDMNNIQKKDPVLKIDLFDTDVDGVSHYKKLDGYEYIITKKSIESIKLWMKNNKLQKNEDNTKYINSIKYIYYVYSGDDVRCYGAINSPHEFVKIMLLTYVNPVKKNDSILRHFGDATDVKIKLVDIVRFNDMKKSGIKMKELRDYYIKIFNENNIFTYILNILKTKYPPKNKLVNCYVYLYTYNNIKKCIVYPEEIDTLNDLKKIIEHIYEFDFNDNIKFKLIATEKCYFMIEMMIILDKYNDKYGDKSKLLIELSNFNRNIIDKTLDIYGFDIYENTKKFTQYIRKFITTKSVKKEPNKKSSKKKSKKTEKKPVKKIIKNIIDNDTEDHEENISNEKPKKKSKKHNDNISTITSDSEDDSDNDSYTDKSQKYISKNTENKAKENKQTFDELKNKSISAFIKHHLHRKKDGYTTIKQLVKAYAKSNEYKKIQKININVNRKYFITYLQKYKWFNDNFREKYKDIRSVLLNYVL